MSKAKVQVHPDHWKTRGREHPGKAVVPEIERAKLRDQSTPPPPPGQPRKRK